MQKSINLVAQPLDQPALGAGTKLDDPLADLIISDRPLDPIRPRAVGQPPETNTDIERNPLSLKPFVSFPAQTDPASQAIQAQNVKGGGGHLTVYRIPLSGLSTGCLEFRPWVCYNHTHGEHAMKKLVRGIVDFRKKIRPGYQEIFARLALGQRPDALFIGCSDSRVAPNVFASTNPGDLFVIRNVGNLISPCEDHGHSSGDESEAAALEFSLQNLGVSDIIVCGHSECGAMQALTQGRERLSAPHLRNWLRHGDASLAALTAGKALDPALSPVNQLSQINVLQQLEHLKSYPIVRERVERKQLSLHGWWFDIAHAEVHAHDPATGRFRPIDESYAKELLSNDPQATGIPSGRRMG